MCIAYSTPQSFVCILSRQARRLQLLIHTSLHSSFDTSRYRICPIPPPRLGLSYQQDDPTPVVQPPGAPVRFLKKRKFGWRLRGGKLHLACGKRYVEQDSNITGTSVVSSPSNRSLTQSNSDTTVQTSTTPVNTTVPRSESAHEAGTKSQENLPRAQVRGIFRPASAPLVVHAEGTAENPCDKLKFSRTRSEELADKTHDPLESAYSSAPPPTPGPTSSSVGKNNAIPSPITIDTDSEEPKFFGCGTVPEGYVDEHGNWLADDGTVIRARYMQALGEAAERDALERQREGAAATSRRCDVDGNGNWVGEDGTVTPLIKPSSSGSAGPSNFLEKHTLPVSHTEEKMDNLDDKKIEKREHAGHHHEAHNANDDEHNEHTGADKEKKDKGKTAVSILSKLFSAVSKSKTGHGSHSSGDHGASASHVATNHTYPPSPFYGPSQHSSGHGYGHGYGHGHGHGDHGHGHAEDEEIEITEEGSQAGSSSSSSISSSDASEYEEEQEEFEDGE